MTFDDRIWVNLTIFWPPGMKHTLCCILFFPGFYRITLFHLDAYIFCSFSYRPKNQYTLDFQNRYLIILLSKVLFSWFQILFLIQYFNSSFRKLRIVTLRLNLINLESTKETKMLGCGFIGLQLINLAYKIE